jgi:hypothetical protein
LAVSKRASQPTGSIRKKRIAGVIMMRILPFVDKQALVAYRQFERGIYHDLGAA